MRTCPNGHPLELYYMEDYDYGPSWSVHCNHEGEWLQGKYFHEGKQINTCQYHFYSDPEMTAIAKAFEEKHDKAVWDYARKLFQEDV